MAKKKYTMSRADADKLQLYQWSVQDAAWEIGFIAKCFRRRRGREARVLREDFCGTALVACEWIKGHPRRQAIGLDLDPATLRWAMTHNVLPLGEDAERVRLLKQDVRSVTRPRADLCVAMNFSHFVFRPLSELTAYFRLVRASLVPGGLLVVDTYGGWEAQQAMQEERKIASPLGSFGYVWQQAGYDAVNNHTTCHIHFKFRNGVRWCKAFSYDWRLYTPAELRDALEGAGFRGVEVYWDFDERDEHSDYRAAKRAENAPAWLAYLVAEAPG